MLFSRLQRWRLVMPQRLRTLRCRYHGRHFNAPPARPETTPFPRQTMAARARPLVDNVKALLVLSPAFTEPISGGTKGTQLAQNSNQAAIGRADVSLHHLAAAALDPDGPARRGEAAVWTIQPLNVLPRTWCSVARSRIPTRWHASSCWIFARPSVLPVRS